MYHVTVLSNFARAFDKYERLYRKSSIPESTYPDEFYVLPRSKLHLGAIKASKLLAKLNIAGDMLIALEASLPLEQLKTNPRNGVGFVWPSPDLPLSKVYAIGPTGELAQPLSVEEATAKSLALHADRFAPYSDLRPRSLSFLPIAKGCQASCPFCFSEASASVEQGQTRMNWRNIRHWVKLAHRSGAERAVITGGGEPTLLPWTNLIKLIHACHSSFRKVVLITNGVKLAAMDNADMAAHLSELHDAGLSILAISRHHPSESINAKLMNLKTRTPALLEVCATGYGALPNMKPRLICVLQKGGIESIADIDDYIEWAASFGIEEVCFKELYVSTSQESVYHSHHANVWSAENQISLSIVHEWADMNGFAIVSRLPWGAPIFAGVKGGKSIRVAAYTEPSLFWERSNNLARSWNVMAGGNCLASLEDRQSVITPFASE